MKMDKNKISSSTSSRWSTRIGKCGDGERRTRNWSSIHSLKKRTGCKLGQVIDALPAHSRCHIGSDGWFARLTVSDETFRPVFVVLWPNYQRVSIKRTSNRYWA